VLIGAELVKCFFMCAPFNQSLRL